MGKIDDNLLKIINSKCGNKEYVNNIKYLYNSGVLTNEEIKLCEKVLYYKQIYNDVDLIKLFNEMNYDYDDLKNIEQFGYSQMLGCINSLITTRREEENKHLIDDSLTLSAKGIYTNKTLDTFFNRYINEIKIEEDDTYEKLYSIDDKEEDYISSANEYIDEISGGLAKGSISSIIGTSDMCKSIWALNITYRCLKENKNVLYISLGTKKEDIYKRLLSRHSCNKKFDKELTTIEMSKEEYIDDYHKVYNDFENFLLKNIIIFDKDDFSIMSIYNLQMLIAHANSQFLKESDNTIDLIVVDDFSNMVIEEKQKTVTNRNTVINYYYKYLKTQANSLLGSATKIPIVITMDMKKNTQHVIDCGYDFNLDLVEDEANIMSDNIYSIYSDNNLRKSLLAKLKVLKSIKSVMEESVLSKFDFNHCYIQYNNYDDDEKQKDQRIKDLTQENENLNKQLEESNKEMLDIILSKSSNEPDLLDLYNL